MTQNKYEEQRYWDNEARKELYARYQLGVYSSFRVEEYASIVERFFIGVESKVVLDVGCGAGVSSLVAARKGLKVIGFDLSPNLVKQAVALAGEEKDASPRFFVGDAEHMAIADESCDICFFGGLLHHFSRDYTQVIKEAYRVLKQGGCLVALEPNLLNIPYRFSFYLVGRKEPHSVGEYPLSPLRLSRDLRYWFNDVRVYQFREEDIPFLRQLGPAWQGWLGRATGYVLVQLKNRLTAKMSRGTFFIVTAHRKSSAAST